MTCSGHAMRIGKDDDDGIFTSRPAGIRDGMNLPADTAQQGLRAAFVVATEGNPETCAAGAKKPSRAFKRQILFRMDKDAQRKAVIARKSFNEWAEAM